MIEMDHEEYNVSLFASDKSACVGTCISVPEVITMSDGILDLRDISVGPGMAAPGFRWFVRHDISQCINTSHIDVQCWSCPCRYILPTRISKTELGIEVVVDM